MSKSIANIKLVGMCELIIHYCLSDGDVIGGIQPYSKTQPMARQ